CGGSAATLAVANFYGFLLGANHSQLLRSRLVPLELSGSLDSGNYAEVSSLTQNTGNLPERKRIL
ncbi:MAG: hypothetical protein ACREMY_32380, partial [bacterium]